MVAESIRKRNKKFCKRCHDKNYIIQCACGHCNQTLTKYTKWNHPRKIIRGHSFFGKTHSEDFRKKHSQFMKGRKSPKILGENNPNWKGDKITYKGLHFWIRRKFPKPEFCHLCKQNPPEEIACITGIYNRQFKNWAWFCFKCHKLWDNIYERNLKPYNDRNKI